MIARPGIHFAALAQGLVLCACGTQEEPRGQGTPAAEVDWSEDDRLHALLAGCARGGYFDRDTSDMIPVLVGKLVSGQRDVLQAVRAELAALGEEALPELARVARELYTQRERVHGAQNVLGVLWLSDAPGAREILAGFLTHPHEALRGQAIRGLTKHAGPADFDALLGILPITSTALRATLVEALHRADPRRLEESLAAWLAAGEESDLWIAAARLVLTTADGVTAARFAPLLEDVPWPQVRVPLLGALARGGDGAALELLAAELEHPEPERRTLALQALEQVGGHLDLVGRVLREDGSTTLRVMAASLLAPAAADPQVRRALRLALDDPSYEVRQVALAGLLGAGNPDAADRALALLGRSRQEMQIALFAVREHWDANPGLAERALAVLDARQRDEAAFTTAERKYLIQAIGLVPGRASAELLVELGRTAQGRVDHMDPHRFHVLHVGNTGPQGLALLRELYAAEADPLRRMDYLWGATFGLDEATRAFLEGVVLSDASSPHEKLLAADRLVRMGPAGRIAPLLKRATLRVEHAEVRAALQCLLWDWYG